MEVEDAMHCTADLYFARSKYVTAHHMQPCFGHIRNYLLYNLAVVLLGNDVTASEVRCMLPGCKPFRMTCFASACNYVSQVNPVHNSMLTMGDML